MTVTIATFYHFTPIAACEPLQQRLQSLLFHHQVKGTITLAPEGVNATIAGAGEAVKTILSSVCDLLKISNLRAQFSYADAAPFQRGKVKVKTELISLGAPADPLVCVGTHVAPKDWNAIITQPDVITIDTRNDYEFRIGHFEGAVNPDTNDFKEMIAFTKDKVIGQNYRAVAMYCTGGIRCEKYSSYLLDQGIDTVYHLEGGIIAYLADMAESESLWRGSCFIFDERVALRHDLTPDPDILMCYGCGNPTTPEDRALPSFTADQMHCRWCDDRKAYGKAKQDALSAVQ
ncbi:MAG: hypothetical protein CMM93_03390 [Rickettsiales bacterium]|nr:hypothetical protein [Rickettsiales bacterium]|tara:strand:- start:1307 stop:2173 length:867 start_codon:yes stop_codon:yes gene_type:complete